MLIRIQIEKDSATKIVKDATLTEAASAASMFHVHVIETNDDGTQKLTPYDEWKAPVEAAPAKPAAKHVAAKPAAKPAKKAAKKKR